MRTSAPNERALVNGMNVSVECKGDKILATILADK